MISPAQSIQNNLGKELGYPGNDYLGECLSWPKQFITDTQGFEAPPSGDGDAKGYWLNKPAPLSKYYEFITNDHNDPNQLPSQYDIAIFDGDVPNSDGAGHICVVSTANQDGFVSWDQNWAGNKKVHAVQHTWKGQGTVLGWMHALNQGSAQIVEAVKVAQVPNSSIIIKINPGTWNVRTEPSMSASVIKQPNGKAAPAEGGQTYGAVIDSNGWAEITFLGQIGYVGVEDYVRV